MCRPNLIVILSLLFTEQTVAVTIDRSQWPTCRSWKVLTVNKAHAASFGALMQKLGRVGALCAARPDKAKSLGFGLVEMQWAHMLITVNDLKK